jgi:hypothetical protein
VTPSSPQLTFGIALDFNVISRLRFQENTASWKDGACCTWLWFRFWLRLWLYLLLDEELLQVPLIWITSSNNIPVHVEVTSCVGLQENSITCMKSVSNF